MLLHKRCFSVTTQCFAKRKQIAIRRKKANVARQAVLQAERSPADFDPIVGQATDFTRALLVPEDIWSSSTHSDESLYFPKTEMSYIQAAVETASHTREKLRSPATFGMPRLNQALNKSSVPRISTPGKTEEERLQQNLEQLTLENDKKSSAGSRIVSLKNANARTIQAYNTALAVREFARKEGDTGSSEVQAAVLTVRILNDARHIAANKKDKHGYKGFRELVHQRQKILKYLRKESVIRYQDCIGRLGLTDQCIVREITM